MEKTSVDLKWLADKWPSEVVAREEVGRFTGGILAPKSMANLDSLGLGPEAIRIGKKVAYRTSTLIAWLEDRSSIKEVSDRFASKPKTAEV